MSRFSTWFGALLAGGGLFALPAPEAAAQFMGPFGRPGAFGGSYYTRGATLNYGPYSLSFRRTAASSYSFPVANTGLAAAGVYGYGAGVNPYFYGTAGGLGGAVYDPDAARLRKAQQAARVNPEARQQIFDQWAVERGGAKPIDAAAGGKPIDGLPADPSEADVLSGKAATAVAAAIRAREGKGATAKAPFFTPDLLDKVSFAGGPSADAVNLLRTGKLPAFPSALADAAFDAPRAAVEREFAAATDALRGGRRVDGDKLAAAVKALKDAYAPRVRGDAGFDDARDAVGFLTRLDEAARGLKDPNAGGLLVPAWRTLGTSAADLVRHMGQFKMEFGPAGADEDGAYDALYRGLVAYHADLARNGR